MTKTVGGVIKYEEEHNGGGRAVAEGILTVLESIQKEGEVELPSENLDPQVMEGMMAGAMMGIFPR